MDDSTVKVASPKLTLYAFHLYKNLADDSKPVDNSNHLWHKCQEIGKKLGIPKLENLSIPENQQILNETDLAYLTPGQSLFEQLVDSIRGIVEIEQTKREQSSLEAERSLENTINKLGIAFGGGAIVSGVVTQHIDKPFAPTINFKYPVHPLVSSLFWSILATLLFFGLGWLITRRKKDSNREQGVGSRE